MVKLLITEEEEESYFLGAPPIRKRLKEEHRQSRVKEKGSDRFTWGLSEIAEVGGCLLREVVGIMISMAVVDCDPIGGGIWDELVGCVWSENECQGTGMKHSSAETDRDEQ